MDRVIGWLLIVWNGFGEEAEGFGSVAGVVDECLVD